MTPSLAGANASDRTPEERMRDERRRMVRERWVHLLLLGFAVSIVVHVIVMLRLWSVALPGRIDDDAAPVEMVLQELPPVVEIVADEIELPDPTPLVLGPVTTELDPNPNLSNEQASSNPNADSYGMLEAPGIGAIVGPGGAGSGIGIGSGRGGGGTSFFGVGGRGTRFAYIVDVSGSMDTDNRLVTAMAELKRSVSALPDFTQFYVVLFSDGPFIPDFEKDGWLKATRANKTRINDWINLQTSRGATRPHGAFELVLGLPQPPDVIFFLTDGEIQDETEYHLQTAAESSKRKVIINTIGFSSEAGKEPLERIARAHRGVFRFVPTRGGSKAAP